MISKPFKQSQFMFVSLILFIIFATAVEARPSNKWRLHFDGKANNDGVIIIEVIPEAGLPIRIQSDIEDNTRENEAAKKVSKDIKAVLDDDYKVNKQDGEEIKIKARRGTPDFELKIISNTVDGLKVKTDRE